MERAEPLQRFVEAAHEAFLAFAAERESRRTVEEVFRSLRSVSRANGAAAGRLPACRHLEAALHGCADKPALRNLADRFLSIEPSIAWKLRSDPEGTASPNFPEAHANALVFGPGGLEDRADAWLGATLMAPGVRYPDHRHDPEEVYVVASTGEFKQGSGNWFSPGPGGSFYNTPGIRHAMRSLDEPFLAFWILQPASRS